MDKGYNDFKAIQITMDVKKVDHRGDNMIKMQKLLLPLLVLIGMSVALNGQATVTIGSGTNTTDFLPLACTANYNYSQQIYTQAQINQSGPIEKLSFYYSSGTITNSNDWVIRIGHTTKTSFTSTTDWVAWTSLTEVFNGTVSTPGSAGWYELQLSTTFEYNNSDNLVIALDENTNQSGTAVYWRSFTSGSNSGMYRTARQNIDPTSPGTASARTDNINQIQLLFGLENPSSSSATPLSYSQVSLSWIKNTNDDNVMVAYNTTNTFGTPVNGTSYNPGNSITGGGTVIYNDSGTSYIHADLSQATTY